jgi:murein DD-endopeptidase MepM/ murein hydrolase activator NlpD
MIVPRRTASPVVGAVVCVVVTLVSGCHRAAAPPGGAAARADRYLQPDTIEIKGTIPRAATLATLFRAHLEADAAHAAAGAVARSLDPRKLREGQPFVLTRTLDGWLRAFRYEVDADRYLRVEPASPGSPRVLTAAVIPYARTIRVGHVSGSINRSAPSLFQAMEATGETVDLSIDLAAVFAGEIDFNSELQPGDAFRLAVDKVVRENGSVSYGSMHAAEFTNAGRVLKAFRFTLPDGTVGFYDEHGRSLKRFFLKSPLKFEPRITSGFSASRLHPVLNVRRAHLGVDYAAPVGAPVVAVSSGVVTQAGFAGDAGRLVVIRHASGYESLYMHLSSILVRVGQRVSQGDTIARVGTSGLSTGPHLDYRLRKNGFYMNPVLEHRRMPPGEPIPSTLLPAFAEARDKAAALLVPGR